MSKLYASQWQLVTEAVSPWQLKRKLQSFNKRNKSGPIQWDASVGVHIITHSTQTGTVRIIIYVCISYK